MKKNVVHFIGSFHQGGSERQAVQLAKLQNDSPEYKIFVATLNKEGPLLTQAEESGFPQISEFRLTSFYNLNFLKQLLKCRRYLRINAIDIVHTHDFYTNVFGILAAKIAGVPVKIASKRETGGVRTNLQNRIEKWIFSYADKIVANSRSVRDHLISNGIPSGKITVIYNGVNFGRLKPDESSRQVISAGFGLPQETANRFIVQLANLRHKVKNQEMLLRAAKRLKGEFPLVHFVFAGEGERIDELAELAGELGVAENTHFIGRCEAVPKLLSIAEIGVLTSTAEGFSNSILEYMGAGKPVVATDTGGAREAIIGGKTGFLVASDNDEELADALAILLRDPERYKKYGELGRKTVEERFSLDKLLVNLGALYAELGR